MPTDTFVKTVNTCDLQRVAQYGQRSFLRITYMKKNMESCETNGHLINVMFITQIVESCGINIFMKTVNKFDLQRSNDMDNVMTFK